MLLTSVIYSFINKSLEGSLVDFIYSFSDCFRRFEAVFGWQIPSVRLVVAACDPPLKRFHRII